MKKFFALLLVTAMTTMLFTGCQNTDKKTDDTTTEAPTDAVTTASPKESSNPDDLLKGLSADGYWIFSVLDDVTLTSDLIVEGEFHSKDDTSAEIYRKLALYAQDADRKVTASYTLTVPNIIVKSPNFRIQEGTVKGNISVDADGFNIANTTVEGDITFKTQEQMDSADLTTGTVTGTVSVE